MATKRMTWMAAALGAVALSGMMGCNGKGGKQSGAAAVSVGGQALTLGDVKSVTVTVSGGITTPVTVPLVGNSSVPPTQYSALVSDLPIGSNYTFTATAYGADGTTVLYQGAASGQTISKNQTANIVIDMNDNTTHVTLDDEAPFIDSITDTAGCVSVNDTVTIKATAHDIDLGVGDTAGMTFVWSVPTSCGSLGPVNGDGTIGTTVPGTDTIAGTSTVVFTAAQNNTNCQVNLLVKDHRMPATLQTTAVVTIKIGDACAYGNAKVTAIPDTCPIITGLTSSASPLVKGVSTTLTVTASDSDSGDVLNYNWTSDCNPTNGLGHFVGANPASATGNPVQFVYDSTLSGPDCNFTVTVDDGTWQTGNLQGQTKCSVITHMSLPAQANGYQQTDACKFGYDYMSTNSVDNNQTVTLEILAPCANPTWSAGTPIAAGALTAPFTTGVTFTTPSDAGNNGATVTVSCPNSNPDLNCSHTFTLIGVNAFCATASDDTPCTDTAHKTDMCIQEAKCRAGSCVTTIYHPACPQSTTACMDNVCQKTTTQYGPGGQCALQPSADGTDCSDGLACDGTADKCAGGTCHPTGSPVTCPATGNPCMVNACTEPNAACVAAPAPVNTLCDDGNPCTGTKLTDPSGTNPGTSQDYCNANGVCVGAGASVACPSGDICTPVTGSDTQYTCPLKVCMQPNYAVSENVPFMGNLAVGPNGEIWTTGSIFEPGWDFGNGTVLHSSGDSDAYLVKLDPATGKASTTNPAVFGFGEYSGGVSTGAGDPQAAIAVSVSQSGTVNMIGTFTAEIDFDPTPTNLLIGGTSSWSFYATFAAGSTGTTAPTFIGAHAVDLGDGNLAATASNPFITNPSLDYFAICGNTTKLVGLWNAAAAPGKSPVGLLKPTAGTYGGGSDIVVAVIKASDGSVVWGKQFGSDGDETCSAIAIDNNGDVIISGKYGVASASSTTVNFGGGSLSNKPAVGDAFIYVAKLSGADGHQLAAGGWGTSPGTSDATALAVDPSNNIVVAGSIGGNVDFGGGVSIQDKGLTDAYVVKFTTTLTPVWAKSFGDNLKDQNANSVACDSSGNIYVGGAYQGSMGSFIGLSVPSNSGASAWVAEMAPDGSALQCAAQSYGGLAGSSNNFFTMAVARTAPAGETNALILGGQYSSQMTIGTTTLNAGSKFMSFVARLTP